MSDWTKEEVSKYSAEWTRQYEKGIEYGIAQENNRIIKLLENDYFHHIWLVGDGQKLHDGECVGCKTIALIKGENK